jgi:hypothetical protein
MRFKDDPEYGTQLQLARVGIGTPKLKKILADRQMENILPQQQLQNMNTEVAIVTSNNSIKQQCDIAALNEFAKNNPLVKRYAIACTIHGASSMAEITSVFKDYTPDKTGNIQSILETYIGRMENYLQVTICKLKFCLIGQRLMITYNQGVAF